MRPPRIAVVVGTRAQFIKTAPLMRLLEERGVPYRFIYTAQHRETIAAIRADFGVKAPDYTLPAGRSEAKTLRLFGGWTCRALWALLFHRREVLPFSGGIVVNHGDTATCLWGTLLARLTGNRALHLESGLRSFRLFKPFPEEITRRLTFALTQVYACPGEWAVRNLRRHRGTKLDTGRNTLCDAVRLALASGRPSEPPPPEPYAVVSVHRFENVFRPAVLRRIVGLLEDMAARVPLLFVLHPATEQQLRRAGLYDRLASNPRIAVRERLPYFDFMRLLSRAEFVVTDGGSNQEELSYLGIPALLLRDATERPEGLGENAVLSKFDAAVIADFCANYRARRRPPAPPARSPSEIVADWLAANGYADGAVEAWAGEPARRARLSVWRLAAGLLVAAVAGFYVAKHHAVLLSHFRHLRPGLLPALAAVSVASVFCNGRIMRALVLPFGVRLRPREWFGLTAAGSLGSYLPVPQAGAITRGLYLHRVHGLPAGAFTATVLVTYAMSLPAIGVFGLAGLGAMALAGQATPRSLWWFFAALAASAAAFSPVLGLLRPFRRLDRFREGLGLLTRRHILGRLALLQAAQLLLSATALWLAYRALGTELAWGGSLMLGLLAIAAGIANVTPGNLGVTESATALGAHLMGSDAHLAVAAYALYRVVNVVTLAVLAGVFLRGEDRAAPAAAKTAEEETPRAGRQLALAAAAVGLGALFLLAAHRQVLGYVCGNDPMLYVRAARVLLAPALYGAQAVREALTFVAPGYPVLLAVALKLFGPLSPYWVNLGFLLALLPVMFFVFRRLMGTDRAAAFALLGWLWLGFGSHELNPSFLLCPFRETSQQFFVYLAYAGVLAGARPGARRGAWLSAASFSLLAACAIREPSALVLPGLLLGMAGLNGTWKERWQRWAWFLWPWVLVAALAAFVLSRVPLAAISQFSVVKYLQDHDTALARARTMLGWFPARSGWLAVFLMALGAARALWGGRVLLAWFFLPGALLFVFYAYMQMHARYFMTALLFLAVFAGYGLDGVCAGVERLAARRRGAQLLRGALTWGCMAALAFVLFRTARGAAPWGPRLSAADVREWRALVSRLEPSADGRVRIAVEQRCRYLEDLLLTYTDADLLDAKEVDGWPARWAPAHYFKPLNRAALYTTPQWLTGLTLFAHRLMRDRMDLVPVGDGEPVIRTVGEGRFEQMIARPWTAGTHRTTFRIPAGGSRVLWFDWGACPPAAVRSVSVRHVGDEAAAEPCFTGDVAGGGLQAIVLPNSLAAREAVLTVTAERPVPAAPFIANVGWREPCVFDFGPDRCLSLNRLLLPLDEGNRAEYPLYARRDRETPFRAPVLHADGPGGWRVRFYGSRGDAGPLFLRCRRRDGSETVADISAANGVCTLELGGGESVTLRLASSQSPVPEDWRVERIAFEYRPVTQRGE